MYRTLYSLATLTVALSLHVAAQAQVNFDFSVSDGGFTALVNSGSVNNPWMYTNSPAGPGATFAWSTSGIDTVSEKSLNSPELVVQANGIITGSFTHRFSFLNGRDGGQLRFIVNGHSETVPQNLITGVTYSATIAGGFNSSIANQRAFSGDSAGFATPAYVTSSFTLGTGPLPYSTGSAFNFTAGDIVQIQFLGSWDSAFVGSNPNWQIGSLDATNLAFAAVPEPATIMGFTAAGFGAIAVGYRCLRRRKVKRRSTKPKVQTA